MKFCEFINQKTEELLSNNQLYLEICNNIIVYRGMYQRYTKAVEEVCQQLGIYSNSDNEIKFREFIKKCEKEKECLMSEKKSVFLRNKILKQLSKIESMINLAKIGLHYSEWKKKALKSLNCEILDMHNFEKEAVLKVLTDNFEVDLVQETYMLLKDQTQDNISEKMVDGKKYSIIAIKYLKNMVCFAENLNEENGIEDLDMTEEEIEIS